jgi:hypothetical protein
VTTFAERADTLREVRITPGYWLVRYHLRAPAVPAAIWWCEHEPGNPENIMDRGYWAASIAGEPTSPHEVIACKDRRVISEREYRFYVADRIWAREYAPGDAAALHPRRQADLTALEPIRPKS